MYIYIYIYTCIHVTHSVFGTYATPLAPLGMENPLMSNSD